MKKDLLVVFFVVLAVAVLIMGTEFQSVEEYYLTHADEITEDSDTVYFSINCENAVSSGKLSESQLKELNNGEILKEKEYVLLDGESVFDMLKRVCRFEKIHMEYQGADKNIYNSAYVQGINYLYEFDCGETSGWIFLVNGKQTDTSCGKYKLQDGDKVEWVYSLDAGKEFLE